MHLISEFSNNGRMSKGPSTEPCCMPAVICLKPEYDYKYCFICVTKTHFSKADGGSGGKVPSSTD